MRRRRRLHVAIIPPARGAGTRARRLPGVLQSDGYEADAAYARLGFEWVGGRAHGRRPFFEADAERPKTAARVLRLWDSLSPRVCHEGLACPF
jgi:hypothetical protein